MKSPKIGFGDFAWKVAKLERKNREYQLRIVSSEDFFVLLSVPLRTIQSEAWLVHIEVHETHLNPLIRMNLYASRSCFQRKSQESSYKLGGSDVVHELSSEPAIFQTGLYGEVLTLSAIRRQSYT